MPHTDTIPVSASIASTGKGIRYVGNWAYAYSGNENLSPGVFLKQLNFTTGSDILVAEFQWVNTETNATRDVFIQIDLNEITVYNGRWENPNITDKGANTIGLIIPPLTHVECYQKNDGNTAGCFLMTGRVYGAE